MFGQVIPRSFLWLVSIWAVLTIGIISCGGDDDENDWVGTWEIETVDGQSLEQALNEEFDLGDERINVSILTNNWTFNDDGTMEAEIVVKVEVKEGGSEISVQTSSTGTGTYSLSGSNYTFTITTEIESGLFGNESETEEDAGTWSRAGNTLTLNSNDGSTTIFKKK